MTQAVISATGLFTPPEAIDNDELVEAFNTYVQRYNERHAGKLSVASSLRWNPRPHPSLKKPRASNAAM